MNANTQAILNAIGNGRTNAKEIANDLGVSVPVVTGSLASLKKNHYVNVGPDLSLTEEGKNHFVKPVVAKKEKAPRVVSTDSKMHKAIDIYNEMKGSVRKDILTRMVAEAGLTKNGASTYLVNIKKRFG